MKHNVGAATLLLLTSAVIQRELGEFIPNQHTSKASNKHESQEDCSRLRAGKVENTGEDQAVNIGLAEGRRDGEATNEKHNGWREHDRENVSEEKSKLLTQDRRRERLTRWLHGWKAGDTVRFGRPCDG